MLTHKHHHLEWGTYFGTITVLCALLIFAGVLLHDCARVLPKMPGVVLVNARGQVIGRSGPPDVKCWEQECAHQQIYD
jgi:hypothetical protein